MFDISSGFDLTLPSVHYNDDERNIRNTNRKKRRHRERSVAIPQINVLPFENSFFQLSGHCAVDRCFDQYGQNLSSTRKTGERCLSFYNNLTATR